MNKNKAFILVNLHTSIKVIFAIILNKLIALYIGPKGLALLGQLQNLIAIQTNIASGSIQTGIIKYSAEFSSNRQKFQRFVKNCIIIIIFLSLIASSLTFYFAKQISELILLDKSLVNVIYLLSSLPLVYACNLYIISFLNGLGKIKLFAIANFIISITNFVFVLFGTINYEIKGLLFGVIITQPIALILISLILNRKFLRKIIILDGIFNKSNLVFTPKLLNFSFGTFSSAILTASSLILIRIIIENKLSLNSSGVWEGAYRISNYLNIFFALPFSVYYLPLFSAENDSQKIKKKLFESIKLTIPIVLILILSYSFFDDYIIRLLFSESFLEINNFIIVLLIGESVKLIATYFSNVFTAKALINVTVIYQIIFFICFLCLSYILIDDFGLQGVSFAYLIASTVYFVLFSVNFALKFK